MVKGFPRSRIIGGVLIAVFLVLLAFRLDILRLPVPDGVPLGKSIIIPRDARDTWMNIYQQGRKIGYAHRSFFRREPGFGVREEVHMRIQTMGVVQGISFRTEAALDQEMTLQAFDMELTSNLFNFQARGKSERGRMSVVVKVAGDERRYDLPLKEGVQLSQGIFARVLRSDLKPGQELTLSIFDPMTMGSRPVRVTFVGEEALVIMERPQALKKYAVDFMGARQYAWVDGEGDVVREEGMLGMVLEKTTRAEARTGLEAGGSADLTDLASVDGGVRIEDPAGLSFLKVKVSDIDARALTLDGDRQTYSGGLLTVRKEVRRGTGGKLPDRDAHLTATPFIQADNAAIRDRAGAIVAGAGTDEQKARRIITWVFANIEKRPVLSVSDALSTLRNRTGDCTEHAVLVAALARAAGIPSLVETGLVYQRGRFYYHAWNAFWLDAWGGWVTADAVLNQLPADVTHLRFVRGEMEKQLDLMGVVGRIRLQVTGMGS